VLFSKQKEKRLPTIPEIMGGLESAMRRDAGGRGARAELPPEGAEAADVAGDAPSGEEL
jgi:hypothetical protein